MTRTQKADAHKWYRDHYEHINKLLDNMPDKTLKVPPTESYDLNNPMAWKPMHWNWFLNQNS